MNIKNNTKKLLASLLIAISFVPFGLKINEAIQNNYFTFASSSSNIINHQGVDFVNLGNNVYVEKSLYDQNPNSYNSNAISQVIENAKRLVKEKVGLDYNINVPIYIVDDNSTKLLKEREAAITRTKGTEQSICIKINYFFEKGSTTLAHEMIHAIISFLLATNYFKLLAGLNEGIATQADPESNYGKSFTKEESKKLYLAKEYPADNNENLKFYLIHQTLVSLWIKEQGVVVIKKFIDLINSGMSSKEAFSSLGGDRAFDKLQKMAR